MGSLGQQQWASQGCSSAGQGLHLILNVSSETRITTTDLSLSLPTLLCVEELLVCTIPKPRAWNHLPFLLFQALLNPSAPEQEAKTP